MWPQDGVIVGPDDLAGLPGADLVLAGLQDLTDGRETVEALAVEMASSRLGAVGLRVASTGVERPSHRLYDRLAREDPRGAHSRYNAIVRRVASFARAAEHAPTR